MNIDRQFANTLATAVRMAAVRELAHYGMDAELKSTRYGSGRIVVTLELTPQGVDIAGEDFARYAQLFDFKPEDYRRKFTHRGIAYRIAGIAPNRPKFPINAVRVSDAKEFKFPADVVQRCIREGG